MHPTTDAADTRVHPGILGVPKELKAAMNKFELELEKGLGDTMRFVFDKENFAPRVRLTIFDYNQYQNYYTSKVLDLTEAQAANLKEWL